MLVLKLYGSSRNQELCPRVEGKKKNQQKKGNGTGNQNQKHYDVTENQRRKKSKKVNSRRKACNRERMDAAGPGEPQVQTDARRDRDDSSGVKAEKGTRE